MVRIKEVLNILFSFFQWIVVDKIDTKEFLLLDSTE